MGNTVYKYHPATREYLGPHKLQPNPEGGYFPRRNTLESEPPAIPVGSVAVANPEEGTWSLMIDKRLKTYYDKSTGEPRKLGLTQLHDSIPSDWTDKPRPSPDHTWNASANKWQLSLAKLRELAGQAINAERERRIEAPITVTIGGQDLEFDADPKSQSKISGVLTIANSGAQMPATITWTLKDNAAVALSVAEIGSVGAALLVRTDTLHGATRIVDTAIASMNRADLEAFDPSAEMDGALAQMGGS